MRIVDLPTLLAMPSGTLFQKTAPAYLDGIEILHGKVGESDFCSMHLAGALDQFAIDAMHDHGTSEPVSFDQITRDATHNDAQLFAVWEPDDVRALIGQLRKVLPD